MVIEGVEITEAVLKTENPAVWQGVLRDTFGMVLLEFDMKGVERAAKTTHRKLYPGLGKPFFIDKRSLLLSLRWLAQSCYSSAVDTQFMEQFGRPYTALDYKVSGVVRDEFPSEVKERLRALNRLSQDAHSMGLIFQHIVTHHRKFS